MKVVRDASRKSVIEAVFGIDGATGVDQLCASIFFEGGDSDRILRRSCCRGRSRALLSTIRR